MARILIIDDEPSIRRSVRKILEIPGHEVDEAADGYAGMAMHATRRYDVIITDFSMPGFDGGEVIASMRRLDEKLKFILISGGDPGSFTTDAADVGAVWVLAKPFTVQELTGLVHAIVEATN
jgi:DNA-binding response OmpR family regulator